MKRIYFKQTLFYHDGIQLFEALDVIGGHYICLLVDIGEEVDQYLVLGVSPEKIQDFLVGSLDLRDLILNREIPEWFLVTSDTGIDELDLDKQRGDILEKLLPEPGFFISTPPVEADTVLVESRRRNNAVLEIKIAPPEASREPRVHATTLAAMINHVQTLVKYSYNQALSNLSNETKKGLDATDAHQLDAVAFASGSFKVVFESSKGPDMFGFVELQRALDKIDEITDNADSPETALEVLKKNKGHLAGAYIRLLSFLIQNKTLFSYQWCSPSLPEPRGRTITESQAGPLYELFTKSEKIGVEPVEIVGYLRKADSKNNSWRIESSEDGREYAGEVKEGSPGLSNLVIDQTYRFICEEHLEEQLATGREIRKLLLVRYTEE